MTRPNALEVEDDLQDVKVKVFRDGKLTEVSLRELSPTMQRTAYAILFSSYEF